MISYFTEVIVLTTEELCFALAKENGTPGDETAAASAVQTLFAPYVELKADALGNLCGTLGTGDVKILLDAHLARVGLVVTEIDEQGFLHVDKAGGVDPRVLVGSEVIVYGKAPLWGVVCSTPPHLLTEEKKKAGVELSDLAVDIGRTRDEAQQLVSVGDRVGYADTQLRLLNGRIASAAFDDRCGVAAVLKAVEAVHDKLQNVCLCVQISVQEEVGGGGAGTGAFAFAPDLAIAVDVGFGDDPFCKGSETIALGKGPSIGLSATLDRALTLELKALAEKEGIPYQHDVMPGRTGTNADHITVSRAGVRTALLSIPLRSMHTGVEVIDVADIDQTAALLAAFILSREARQHD